MSGYPVFALRKCEETKSDTGTQVGGSFRSALPFRVASAWDMSQLYLKNCAVESGLSRTLSLRSLSVITSNLYGFLPCPWTTLKERRMVPRLAA